MWDTWNLGPSTLPVENAQRVRDKQTTMVSYEQNIHSYSARADSCIDFCYYPILHLSYKPNPLLKQPNNMHIIVMNDY